MGDGHSIAQLGKEESLAVATWATHGNRGSYSWSNRPNKVQKHEEGSCMLRRWKRIFSFLTKNGVQCIWKPLKSENNARWTSRTYGGLMVLYGTLPIYISCVTSCYPHGTTIWTFCQPPRASSFRVTQGSNVGQGPFNSSKSWGGHASPCRALCIVSQRRMHGRALVGCCIGIYCILVNVFMNWNTCQMIYPRYVSLIVFAKGFCGIVGSKDHCSEMMDS